MSHSYCDIVKVKVSMKDCYETCPCSHKCLLTFSDGTKKSMILGARACDFLLKKTGSRWNPIRRHFASVEKLPSAEMIVNINKLLSNG